MNDSVRHRITELSWRQSLSASEQAELNRLLAENPQMTADWKLEQQLSNFVARLPDAPVPTNFTSRVMQEIGRETSAHQSDAKKYKRSWWAGFGWAPRMAVAGLSLFVGLIAFQQWQFQNRVELARSTAEVSTMATLPKIEWLQDFETISHLNQPLPVDEELLAALSN